MIRGDESVFPDLKTALNHISIPQGWAYLKVYEHPKSLEQISQGGHIIHIIGNGVLRSPGHPAGNQIFAKQLPFFGLIKKQAHFPIFYMELNGDVVYMGCYSMLDYKKKVSFEGFSYFEYKMARVKSKNVQHAPIYSSTALTILG